MAQTTFELEILDVCAHSEFLEFIIPDIIVKVHDPSLDEQAPEVQDSISLLGGKNDGLTFCGTRTYELLAPESHQAYLTLTDRTITVLSDDDSEMGNYDA